MKINICCFGFILFMCGYVGSVAAQESLLVSDTIQIALQPEIYGGVFVGSLKVENYEKGFNPVIDIFSLVFNFTTEERKGLKNLSLSAKNGNESIKKEIKQLNKHAKDFNDKYSKLQAKKDEKYCAIKAFFVGARQERFVFLFRAREVYHMPRLASRDELSTYVELVRQDVYKLGKQIGLSEAQSERLNTVIQGYYSDMGHVLNEVSFYQDYVGAKKDGQKDPIGELHSLVSQVNEIKTETGTGLDSILDEKQTVLVEKWLGWN